TCRLRRADLQHVLDEQVRRRAIQAATTRFRPDERLRSPAHCPKGGGSPGLHHLVDRSEPPRSRQSPATQCDPPPDPLHPPSRRTREMYEGRLGGAASAHLLPIAPRCQSKLRAAYHSFASS